MGGKEEINGGKTFLCVCMCVRQLGLKLAMVERHWHVWECDGVCG